MNYDILVNALSKNYSIIQLFNYNKDDDERRPCD
jgi:hypothetical protein